MFYVKHLMDTFPEAPDIEQRLLPRKERCGRTGDRSGLRAPRFPCLVVSSYLILCPFTYLFRIYFCTYVNFTFVYISVRLWLYDPPVIVRQCVYFSVRFTCVPRILYRQYILLYSYINIYLFISFFVFYIVCLFWFFYIPVRYRCPFFCVFYTVFVFREDTTVLARACIFSSYFISYSLFLIFLRIYIRRYLFVSYLLLYILMAERYILVPGHKGLSLFLFLSIYIRISLFFYVFYTVCFLDVNMYLYGIG